MTEITLQLSEKVYRQAERWALVTNQELDVALAEAIEVALTPVYANLLEEAPITSLSDDDILTLTYQQLPIEVGRRLSQLSAGHSEDTLTADEQQELMALTGSYQQYWLRQAEALAEAVRRSLLTSMHS